MTVLETAIYDSGDGVRADELMRVLRRRAQRLANDHRETVEVETSDGDLLHAAQPEDFGEAAP